MTRAEIVERALAEQASSMHGQALLLEAVWLDADVPGGGVPALILTYVSYGSPQPSLASKRLRDARWALYVDPERQAAVKSGRLSSTSGSIQTRWVEAAEE